MWSVEESLIRPKKLIPCRSRSGVCGGEGPKCIRLIWGVHARNRPEEYGGKSLSFCIRISLYPTDRHLVDRRTQGKREPARLERPNTPRPHQDFPVVATTSIHPSKEGTSQQNGPHKPPSQTNSVSQPTIIRRQGNGRQTDIAPSFSQNKAPLSQKRQSKCQIIQPHHSPARAIIPRITTLPPPRLISSHHTDV